MYGTGALLCVSGTPTREDDTCEARMAQYRVSLISETRMAQYLLLLFSETRMAQYRYLLPLFSETRMAQYRVSLISEARKAQYWVSLLWHKTMFHSSQRHCLSLLRQFFSHHH